MRQRYQGKGLEVDHSAIDSGSLLPKLVSQCGDGQEGEWQMENMLVRSMDEEKHLEDL